MVEYAEIEERRVALGRLLGIEDNVWVQVDGFERVHAIADEDLERDTEEKTSAVHFLRFELEPDMVSALHGGAALSAGIDHPEYNHSVSPLPEDVRGALLADLH